MNIYTRNLSICAFFKKKNFLPFNFFFQLYTTLSNPIEVSFYPIFLFLFFIPPTFFFIVFNWRT